ncbi:MAG: NUDIX hydrolase [Candidatus Uhrbacteria bacterium GW2011_GWE2_46_68]|uniref:NUDIX hydrolase n=2 Tax=Candidatus Uhriibacteriota TaxID=1752732 RepID=A0A0G1Q6B3_9BACT|nr:MAG: NUDIX hydrolase [Candidatus Uhrbacteria bacterium GW2011_GWF2_46_218]KKU40559.1 MAG: NUDIX hydrolase [Candidatus Uhrbacteria bacterium GW2011_GWE2_46_68]
MSKETFDNQKKYSDTLPKKYMAAGALFFNKHHELLILHPTYKDRWEICGGIVETNESPRSACEREILEEIGLSRSVGRLLCVDYSVNTEHVENLQFIFDGGVLTENEIKQIRLAIDEISSFEFIGVESKEDNEKILQRDRLGPRLIKALEAKKHNKTFYLEKGK